MRQASPVVWVSRRARPAGGVLVRAGVGPVLGRTTSTHLDADREEEAVMRRERSAVILDEDRDGTA